MLDDARLPDRALMQDPAFAQAMRLCGQTPVHLPGGLMLLQRRIAGLRIVMVPRAIPPPDLLDQLSALGLHRCPVILSPDVPCALPRSIRLLRPRDICVMSLAGSDADRRARLHPKWRNQVTRAERLNLTVSRSALSPDPDDPVLVTETRQAQARGYANWPAALTAAFAAAAPAQTHLFRATQAGRTVAHMLFLTHGASATYHLGHITADGRRLCAHNLLLWQAASHLARMGCRSLDLGLLDSRTPTLNRFKLRSGGIRRQTGGTHLLWHPLARA